MPAAAVDALVIGGGAAGLMCAVEAGKRGRRVVVLEHNSEIGRKILISGGGRCNFTNLHAGPENFFSANPHFAKSALARYTPQDFIALVRRYGVAFHEKTLGQLFCDGSAREIVDMLRAECSAAGVRIRTGCPVRSISPGFEIATDRETWRAASLVIATGGLSIPKMGATAFGYDIARRFGHRIVECRPALVPLTFSPADRDRWGGLSGVSTEVVTAAGGRRFREKMLFTHRGLSGPAILQVSSYWTPGECIEIDLLPEIDISAELRDRRTSPAAALARRVPRRLADRWFELHPPGTLAVREIREIADALHHWRVAPAGTEGFEKAEVTAGGVDTAGLSSQTMESRTAPGLYFIGEAVDVTGHLGGFNFQWAWASGFAAGQAV